MCPGRREHEVGCALPDSNEHLQLHCIANGFAVAPASYSRAITWVWEHSSQWASMKLLRVPWWSLNNWTSRGVSPSPTQDSYANFLVSCNLCSAFLCIEPSPIWSWILRLWFPTLHLLWLDIFSHLTQYLTFSYVGCCFLYVQCFGALFTFPYVSELNPSPTSWPDTGLSGWHLERTLYHLT